jgi:non-ribosomal peptide synthetase component F
LNPHAAAVESVTSSITYSELDALSSTVAGIIIRKYLEDSKRNQLIAISMEKSASLIVCILAVLKAGASYLPIDPKLPADRIQFMLEDSGVKLVLVSELVGRQFESIVGSDTVVANVDSMLK